MRARVPLDVDLQDRLIYGLTPGRFAYLVGAGLLAMASWYSLPFTEPLRFAVVLAILLIGAAQAWGRWRGRTFDAWLADAVLYLFRNYRVRFDAAPLIALVMLPRRLAEAPCRWLASAAQWLVQPLSA